MMKWIIYVMAFLITLEVCARVDDSYKWNAPLIGTYNAEQLRGIDYYGVRCRPNSSFEKWTINKDGFQGEPLDEIKPADEYRVFVVGASESFGIYESPGHHFPDAMQKKLHEDGFKHIRVINASCPGMNLSRITYYLEYVNQFDPDMVLLYPTPHFYLESDKAFKPWTVHKEKAQKLKKNDFGSDDESAFQSRLLAKAKTLTKSLLPATFKFYMDELSIEEQVELHEDNWVWDGIPQDRLTHFNQELSDTLQQAQDLQMNMVVATHINRFAGQSYTLDKPIAAVWRKFHPRAEYQTLIDFDTSANKNTCELAVKFSFPCIDIASMIPPKKEYFADFSHFTDAGASFVGITLADQLQPLLEGTNTFSE